MRSIYPGLIAPVFSVGTSTAGATATGVGTTFAVPATPQGGGKESEVVVEYTEQTTPGTVSMDLEGGNTVDGSENLVAPLEVLATINTLGNKSIRQKIGQYRFVRLNLKTLTGGGAEVSGKIGM